MTLSLNPHRMRTVYMYSVTYHTPWCQQLICIIQMCMILFKYDCILLIAHVLNSLMQNQEVPDPWSSIIKLHRGRFCSVALLTRCSMRAANRCNLLTSTAVLGSNPQLWWWNRRASSSVTFTLTSCSRSLTSWSITKWTCSSSTFPGQRITYRTKLQHFNLDTLSVI